MNNEIMIGNDGYGYPNTKLIKNSDGSVRILQYSSHEHRLESNVYLRKEDLEKLIQFLQNK